jgi:CubicO group peptidase (beta-lactamase class C family)
MAEQEITRRPGDLDGADVLRGVDLGAVDEIVRSFAARNGQPGLAYGIVAGGALVHAGGLGERWLGGPVPDAGTVFRIASMTKSFTASTVLMLRDEGALRLDDPAEEYVAELREVRLPSADSPRITVRQLLTMTAGFLTDDPWGDRQQGLPAAEFSRLLRGEVPGGGVRVGWAPGTRFEYSNLGYAILGKVIEAVTGGDYADAVRARVLRPLGLTRTGYDVAEFGEQELARGYQRGSGGWTELVPDGHGAFAPMGGIFSTVTDLARWVSGFADAFPPRDGEGAAHPLSRATRREMQLSHIAIITPAGGTYPDASTPSYGYGLFVDEDPAFGTIVQHSGGYPGFGSNMRWHPATGIGVVVLGNGTYANAHSLGARMLSELLRQAADAGGAPRAAFGPAPGDGGPWPETLAARDEVNGLLQGWDDAVAERLFTPNVAWDQQLADRRAAIERVRERIGDFRPDSGRPAESDSPAHCRWWLRGDRGTVQVEIKLPPLVQPLVQWLRLAVPPAPGSALLRLLDSVIGMVNDGSAPWPDWLPAAADLDTAEVTRRLRVAAAWAGRCTAGAFRGGDGETSTTVELDGDTGRVVLAIAMDREGEALSQADITLLP